MHHNHQNCWFISQFILGVVNFIWVWTYVSSLYHQFSSVQSLSLVWLFVTPWTAACQASPSIINSQSLLKLMSVELVIPSNHLILCVPFFSCFQSFPASVFFQWVSFCIMWPKYWSFSFSISPSNEYLGLISFRMDWLDLLAVQGTLQESSLTPQSRSINSSVLSFLYGPTLTSIHDYIQNILSALKSSVLCVFISLPPKLQAPGKHLFEPFIVSVILP